MQVDDLVGLCDRLRIILPNFAVLPQFRNTLVCFSGRKIDKDAERHVKEMVYRLETLLREMHDFMEQSGLPAEVEDLMSEISSRKEGSFSRLMEKSSRISIDSELELILTELCAYPWEDKSLVSNFMVGTEFHHRKEELIQLLLDSNSDPRVVILGNPGSGKSTLISHALLDSRVTKYFYRIDTGKFASQKSVNAWLNGTRWLSVVDDSVDVEEMKFLSSVDEETLLSLDFFKSIKKGSKIIITSTLDLEHIRGSKLCLPSLDEDESWSLYEKTAFTDGITPLSIIHHKIYQKCDKIPGVINIIASILSSKSTTEECEHFYSVLTASVPNPITLISSTIELTKPLSDDKKIWGHCFAWCSLFPTDYEFTQDLLFHLWRAQEEFTQDYDDPTSITKEQLEYCFHEFLKRGYFIHGKTIGSMVSYRINHLVFELMKYVAGDDFCLMDKTTPEPNHNLIRHLSFIVDPSWEPPSCLLKAKQLQSLLLWPRKSGEFIPLSKLQKTLASMTQLRTFYAEVEHCELYPAFLAKLKRLKYRRLGLFPSISLPKDIPALQKLQYIDLRYISTHDFTPSSDDSLIVGSFGEEERFALLIKFTTFKKLTVQYENCDELTLEQTNRILGSLSLQPSSFDEDDWKQTSLNSHQSLESLVVCQWKGETLPAWVIDESSIFLRSLLSIQIANCGGCQHLPGFNTLPLLSSLQLWDLPSLIDITISGHDSEACSKKSVYLSLKCLVLCDLPELMGWLSKESDHNILQHYFPVLTEVRIQGCPKLVYMPSVPTLESFEAINSDFKMLTDLMFPSMIDPSLNIKSRELIESSENIKSRELIESSEQHLSLIKSLEIDDCKKFSWGDEPNNGDEKGAWHAIESLNSLKLSNIPEITSFPRNLDCFITLNQLTLCWLVNLKVLPEWIGQLTHLRQLTVHYCSKLTMLPKSDGSFSALEQLEIRCCPRVSQFPKLLPNLKRLQVQEFGRLEQILCLTLNLEVLEINDCYELQGGASENVWDRLNSLHSLKLTKMDTFPKGLDFAKLPKLHLLVLAKCPNLPEDWSLIKHIPRIVIN